MAQQFAVDTGLAEFIYTGPEIAGGLETTCGFGFEPGPPSQTAINELHDAWADNIPQNQSSAYTFQRVEFTWQEDVDTVTEHVSTAGPQAGGGSASALPSNCALIVAKQTAVGGRANRGRFFLPGLPEAGVTEGGNVTSPGTWSEAFEVFRAAAETAGFVAVLHHRALLTFTPINGFVARTKIGTQRTRLRN